eukprot:sb/3471656/
MQAVLTYLQGCFIHGNLFDRTSSGISTENEEEEGEVGESDVEQSGGGALTWSTSDALLHPIKHFLGMLLQTAGIGYYSTILCYISYSHPPGEPDSCPPLTKYLQTWHLANTHHRLTNEAKILKSSLQRCQLELIAFQWLHEGPQLAGSPRKAFITDLTNKISALDEAHREVTNCIFITVS